MKTWLKLLCVLAIMGISTPAFGGGVDNKQNFSAAYAGSLSRNAATDGADVAAYNPAGMMLLDNGSYLDINAQPFTFDYDHTFNGQTYTASPTLVTPTAFAIHKTDNWAVFGSFTINGGGGETEYENGNIITESIGNMASLGAFFPAGLLPGGSFENEYAYAESYDYTFTTGASYKINNIFSVAAGIRYVLTDKEVDIHGDYAGTHIIGKYEQEADGFGGVFGLNIHPNDTLNIGIRYETRVNLDWETQTGGSTPEGQYILGVFGRVDGESYARDLPAVLALGLEWRVLPKLTISPSYTLYFEKDADWGTQNYAVDDNSYDLGLALQYDINEKWSATAGYLYIDVGVKPENYGIIEKMNPPLDCHALALGAKYKMNEHWRFTFGLTGYFYEDDTAPAVTSAALGGATVTPEVTYDKELYSGAFGIQYKF